MTKHPPGSSPTATILFFTKAPRPGEVKTRLAKDTGAARAAALHAAFVETLSHMLERAADTLRQRHPGSHTSLLLARADLLPHPLFDEDILIRRTDGATRPLWGQLSQRGGDLGARLQNALLDVEQLHGDGKVIIIVSDSPTLSEERIIEAVELLDSMDVVLGPSFDGGYYLIGLRSVKYAGVFEQISWSSSAVLGQTLERCHEHALKVALLQFWYDVDTVEDLAMLRTHLLQYLVASPDSQHYSRVVEELEQSTIQCEQSES